MDISSCHHLQKNTRPRKLEMPENSVLNMLGVQDFYEIDFPKLDSSKSGDTILLGYRTNGETFVHVVDGGYQSSGEFCLCTYTALL